jgi:hypothetical protein
VGRGAWRGGRGCSRRRLLAIVEEIEVGNLMRVILGVALDADDDQAVGAFDGSGRKRKTLAMLKIAVLAPMPSASAAIAAAVKVVDFLRTRRA